MLVKTEWKVGEGDSSLEVPWENPARQTRYLDLRVNSGDISQIEPARRQRPLHTFLSALNSGDSVFSTIRSQTWLEPESAGQGTSIFASLVGLIFTSPELNFDRGGFDGLAQRLSELLSRDTGALAARLRVRKCRFHEKNRDGFALEISLAAEGETPGQAELRWGLGIVRVQQALLYLSRNLRQQMPATG